MRDRIAWETSGVRPARMRGVVSCVAVMVLALSSHLGSQETEAQDSGSPLAADSLDDWLTQLRPQQNEQSWQDMPWRNSFRRAAQDAHEVKKPVLLWAMNGHPLGCT